MGNRRPLRRWVKNGGEGEGEGEGVGVKQRTGRGVENKEEKSEEMGEI